MLVRTTTLLGCSAVTGDDALPVTEVLFDPRTGALRFLVIDVGSWFHEVDVLVAAREMGALIPDARRWHTALDRAAIEAAPHWSASRSTVIGLALENWPPLIVGPFGSTYSPLLLEAQAAAAFSPEPAAAHSKTQGLEPVSAWHGMAGFGEDGEIGQITDLTVDTDSHVIHQILLTQEARADGSEAVLPFARLRHRAEGQDYAVFDATAADVTGAPGPETLPLAD